MLKLPGKLTNQNFATMVGVLVVVAVFGLAIGIALFVQNGERVQQIWPLRYFMR